MENLSFVPGTVGATPVQNVGCYGVSVSDIIDWVEVYDMKDNTLHILSPKDCEFGYRDSVFKHAKGREYVVTRVAYRLSTHPNPRLSYADLAARFEGRTDVAVGEVREALHDIRGKKFPDLGKVGTAGSFFKNPVVTSTQAADIEGWLKEEVPQYPVDEIHVKIPLAWLLEKFGWKGRRRGAVGCWKDQALVLVHYGGGTADDLILFAYDIMSDVKKHTSLKIEPEVCVVGDKYLAQRQAEEGA
jgi:UDP-N-acetylmuramate dehydrogenase